MAETVTRVLLADDQALYSEALKGLIDRWQEYDVVGSAADGQQAVELARRLRPDLILMDVSMPVMGGIEATRIIHAELPDTTIVMITVESDKDLVLDALLAGAQGYMLKDTPARKLRDRLRAIMQGEMALSESVTGSVVDELLRLRDFVGTRGEGTSSSGPEASVRLSERDRDILRLVAQGKSNEEISEILYLGLGTVKKQLSNLMLRLGLENRVQAAVFAVKIGLE